MIPNFLPLLASFWIPSVLGNNVVCYYTSWAHYRTGAAKYTVEDVPVGLCTHVIYAFAVLDANTLTTVEHDVYLDKDSGLANYRRFLDLRKRNPSVKLLLGLGGWTDSRSDKYSRLVSSSQRRAAFVSHVVSFLTTYGFDGLDLDWEYPGYQSSSLDKEGFRLWVEELRAAFSPHGLLLTATVSARRSVIDEGYDVAAVARALDQIHLMSYDFHGSWEYQVAHHAPLFPSAGQQTELSVDFAVRYWIKKGAPASKLVLGVPFYGRSWTLAGTDSSTGAPASGPGRPGPLLKMSGVMAYFEICVAHVRFGWPKVQHINGPHLTLVDQWVGYDDVNAVVQKAKYSIEMGLAGIMVWDVTFDDFRGFCEEGTNPLLSAISRTLAAAEKTTTAVTESTAPATPPTQSHSSEEPPSTTPRPANSNVVFPTFEETPVTMNVTECRDVGYTRDPLSCTHFYRCAGTRAFHFTCPSGLVWNQELLLCDWPSAAPCEISLAQFIRAGAIWPPDNVEVIVDEVTDASGYFSHYI